MLGDSTSVLTGGEGAAGGALLIGVAVIEAAFLKTEAFLDLGLTVDRV
jgi:hypothetical protein